LVHRRTDRCKLCFEGFTYIIMIFKPSIKFSINYLSCDCTNWIR
jgi:hypothetical protein